MGLAIQASSGCYNMRPSSGGGQTGFSPPRMVRASDVALPTGYRIEAVATGLTFPTGVAFDDNGNPYVVQSGYSYGEVWTAPRPPYVWVAFMAGMSVWGLAPLVNRRCAFDDCDTHCEHTAPHLQPVERKGKA